MPTAATPPRSRYQYHHALHQQTLIINAVAAPDALYSMIVLSMIPTKSNPTQSEHFPALDGIRGIAILLVLFSHAVDFLGPVPSHIEGAVWPERLKLLFIPGWGGVDLFFALSGFLITGILLRSRNRKTYFSSFYARRALRIFPIYYLFLLLCIGIGAHWPNFDRYLPHSLHERISYFIYLQNWPIFWKSWAGMSGLWGAYWSLAVEEQFYFVWPTMIRFVTTKSMFYLCILGFLLGLPERVFMIHHLGLQLGILQWPFSRLDGLFLGAAIALYREEWGRIVPMKWAIAAFSLGAFSYGWLVIFHHTELRGAGPNFWRVGVAAFALMSAGLIAATEHRPHWLVRALTIKPLLVAGRYSYGIYVYHLMFYVLMQWIWFNYVEHFVGYHLVTSIIFIAATISITFVFSAASFHFYEAPLLRLKRFFPSPAAPV